MSLDRVASRNRILDNYEMLLLSVQEIIAAPPGVINQAKIQAVVAAAGNMGQLIPQIDSSVGGASYNWTAYQNFILSQIKALEEAIQRAGGPMEVVTRCHT